MILKNIMTKAPTCCSPDTKVDVVARLMLEHDCGEIPVCEGAKLVGVVTDRDIACRAFAKGKDPFKATARDVMTKFVVTIDENADLEAAVDLMQEHQVRRLPVTRDGKLTGIISQADLVASLPDARAAALVKAISRPARIAV